MADLERAKQCVDQRAYDAAIGCAAQLDTPEAVVQALAELMLYAYWERKDLEGVIALGRAGLARALQAATESPDDALALKRKAVAITHNIASFCWAGWDEPGITIHAADARIGKEAATQHIDLVQELRLPDLQQSRAWWMVGAHEMSNGAWSSARAAFEQATALAERAGSQEDHGLFQGYVLLVDLLTHPDDNTFHEQLYAVKSQLAQLPHGEDSIQQLDTAEAYFKRIA